MQKYCTIANDGLSTDYKMHIIDAGITNVRNIN